MSDDMGWYRYDERDREAIEEAMKKLVASLDENGKIDEERITHPHRVYVLEVYTGGSKHNDDAVWDFMETGLPIGNTMDWHFGIESIPREYYKFVFPLDLVEGKRNMVKFDKLHS